jgi:hypothetical protein
MTYLWVLVKSYRWLAFRLWWDNVKVKALKMHLLTPGSRVLLEKLIGLQLVKKFPAFYGTRRFITVFTSARHLSVSSVSSIQSIPPHSISWRLILILSSHLRRVSQVVCFPQVFPPKPCTKYYYGRCTTYHYGLYLYDGGEAPGFRTFNMNINVTPRPFYHELKKLLVPSGQEAPADYVSPTFVPVITLAEFLVPLRATKS